MGIVYILTVIVLLVAFMLFKKSDEKQNFIKWLIIFTISLLGYNILIGMILGLLNITSHLWLLSLINLVFAVILGYKAVRKKEVQKYNFSFRSCYFIVVLMLIILGIIAVIAAVIIIIFTTKICIQYIGRIICCSYIIFQTLSKDSFKNIISIIFFCAITIFCKEFF